MKGFPYSRKRAGIGAPCHNDSIALNGLAVSVADGAPGYGSAVISGLPVGNILFLGAVLYAQFTTADADVTDTFDGDMSVGTAATADGTLSGAEVDIVPSTALGAATAKVSPVAKGVSTDALGGVIIDNTDGDKSFNLNLLIDDAAISGAADFTVDGVLHVAYIILGDD